MKSHKGLLLLAVFVVFCSGGPLLAECPVEAAGCLWVDDDACPGVGTGTELDPYCRIQDAYDDIFFNTTPNDTWTVLVKPGTYSECVVAWGFNAIPALSQDRPINLVAEHWQENGQLDPDEVGFDAAVAMTTIDGSGVCDLLSGFPDTTLALGGTGASVEGFTITNAGRSGIFAQGGVAISNNLIAGNESDFGAGIYLYTGTCIYDGDQIATISKNIIENNVADDFNEIGFGDGAGIGIVAEGSELEPAEECMGGSSVVNVEDNIIRNNTARNLITNEFLDDLTSLGGGIFVQGITPGPFISPPDVSQATVKISRNVIDGNVVEGAAGYGGGIWANTFGYGMETIEISDNTITNNSANFNGGGVSGWVTPLTLGLHEMRIEGNTVSGNSAEFGGGMDLLVFVRELGPGQRLALETNRNVIDGNDADFDGGGIFGEFTALKTSDVDDATSNPFPADEVTFEINGNTISNNTSGLGGAGVTLLPAANADPDGTEAPELCVFFDQVATVAHIEADNNLIFDNTAENFDPVQSGDIVGAGVLLLPEATGEALASVAITRSTIAGNGFVVPGNGGFVGGVETSAYTLPDCNGALGYYGYADLIVDRTILDDNDGDAVGGPPPDPGLLAFVTRTLAHVNPPDPFGFNDPDCPYEDTLFPVACGAAPGGNFDPAVDPTLDPTTFITQVCSPAFFVGACDDNPNTICFDDTDCSGSCLFDGAGYLGNPDFNFDNSIDGVDILNISVAFGSSEGQNRYDASVDLDRNGMVDGDDLMYMAPEFGQVCLP